VEMARVVILGGGFGGEVAAANLIAEIEGRDAVAHYSHEMRLVIEEPGDSIYLHKDVWMEEPGSDKLISGAGPSMFSRDIGSIRIHRFD